MWGRRLGVRLGVFRHEIEDLFTTEFAGRDPASGLLTYQPANAEAARLQGVETELTVAPAGWVTAALGYNYLDAEDRATGGPLALRARHTVKGRLLVRGDRIGTSAALFGRYLGRRPFADADGDGRIDEMSPAFAIWDVGRRRLFAARDLYLSKTLERFEIFAGADNLFARRDARYLPSAGRRAYAGAAVRYQR